MSRLKDEINKVFLNLVLEQQIEYSSMNLKMFHKGLLKGAELVTIEDIKEIVQARLLYLESKVTYDTRVQFGKEIDKATKLIEAIENYLEE